MRRQRVLMMLATLVVLAVGVAACGLPERKDAAAPVKVAVNDTEAQEVFDHFREVRSSAFDSLAAGPLTTIEAGPVLVIDTGGIKVRRLLGDDAQLEAVGSQKLTLLDVYAPRFDEYPLWFVAVVQDEARDLTRLQLFARAKASTPWTLVASPETLSAKVIPQLAHDPDGALTPLPPDERSGLAESPQAAAQTYAKVLAGKRSGDVEQDSFVQQMRQAAQEIESYKGVTYSQTWKPHDVHYALRTSDGGALVFATLTRDDDYRIKDGVFIDWPEGSEQKAFLSGKLFAHGKLRYYHQLLLYVPPEGKGAPRAIGQYGGIIDGDGY